MAFYLQHVTVRSHARKICSKKLGLWEGFKQCLRLLCSLLQVARYGQKSDAMLQCWSATF